jgi:hypothetical protein
MRRPVVVILPALSLLLGAAVAPAAAQPAPADALGPQRAPRFFAAASLAGYRAGIEPFSGSSAAPGLGVGAFLTPHVSVEAELLRPALSARHDYSGWSISLAPPGATREEIERMAVWTQFNNHLSIPWAGSVAAGFNTDRLRRVSARALVGLAFRKAIKTRDDLNVQAPPGHTLAEFPDRHERSEETTTGLLLGLAVPVRVTGALAVVPQIRLDWTVRGDHFDNILRPAVALEWRF